MTKEKIQPSGRWLMWSMLALAYIIVYVHRVAPSVVADHLMETFAIKDGAVLGSLAAMYFYVYLVMQIPSGIFADSFGPRATVSAGVLFAAFGTLFFAVAQSVFLAFLGRFLVGLGVSVIFVSILKFHSVWFSPTEFAFITGLLILVGNFGAMMATTPLALLVNFMGWRASFLLIGLFSVLVAVACWRFVRDTPLNARLSAEELPLKERLGENLLQLRIVLKNPYSWPPFLVAFGLYGTLITFQGMWGVPYLMQIYGMSRTSAANLMLLIGAGMAAGSPVMGFLSDRLRRRKIPYVLATVLYSGCWAAIVLWNKGLPPVVALYPLCFFLGFFGGTMTITFAAAKEVNPPQVAGTAIAVANMGGFLGIAILQPLFGYLLDLRWEGVMRQGVKIYSQAGYYTAFLYALFFLAFSLSGALMLRETGGKNIYSSK